MSILSEIHRQDLDNRRRSTSSGYVFLSHEGIDKPRLKPFFQRFRDEGLRVFEDSTHLRAGDDLQATIRKELREASCVVYFITETTIERSRDADRWTLYERVAADVDDKLLQFCIDPVDLDQIPNTLLTKVIKGFRQSNDLTDEQKWQHPEFTAFIEDVRAKAAANTEASIGRTDPISDVAAAFPMSDPIFNLVDRVRQCAQTSDIVEANAETQALAPQVLLVYGRRSDYPPEFCKRLIDETLPELTELRDALPALAGKAVQHFRANWLVGEKDLEAMLRRLNQTLRKTDPVTLFEPDAKPGLFARLASLVGGGSSPKPSRAESVSERVQQALIRQRAITVIDYEVLEKDWHENTRQQLDALIGFWSQGFESRGEGLPILMLRFVGGDRPVFDLDVKAFWDLGAERQNQTLAGRSAFERAFIELCRMHRANADAGTGHRVHALVPLHEIEERRFRDWVEDAEKRLRALDRKRQLDRRALLDWGSNYFNPVDQPGPRSVPMADLVPKLSQKLNENLRS